MLEIIILSRVTHYVATLALFGMSVFPLYTYGKNRPRLHLVTIWWLALAALLGAVFWFGSVAFSMAGKLDSEAVSSVLSETSFGKVWIIRIILATIILLIATVNLKSRLARFGWLFPALCAASVASLAGVGHTQIDSGVTHIITRMRGDGPPYIRVGRSVRYAEAALIQWMKSRQRSSTSEQ